VGIFHGGEPAEIQYLYRKGCVLVRERQWLPTTFHVLPDYLRDVETGLGDPIAVIPAKKGQASLIAVFSACPLAA